jgi:hypothetical protein
MNTYTVEFTSGRNCPRHIEGIKAATPEAAIAKAMNCASSFETEEYDRRSDPSGSYGTRDGGLPWRRLVISVSPSAEEEQAHEEKKRAKGPWVRVARLEPPGEGQRFFIRDGVWDPNEPLHVQDRARAIREGGVSLYICDNSGSTPDQSDDGPLRWIRDEPLHVEQWSHGFIVTATVECETGGSKSRCGLTLKEALWLVENANAEIVLSTEVAVGFEEHAKLWRAFQDQKVAGGAA